LNAEKTKTGMLNKEPFAFLGYKLQTNGNVGVRDISVNRKIASLAGKISSADHKKIEFQKLHNIDRKTYKTVLIEDINEQITGAISGSKRYGWLFYFSQINDIALLYRLDCIVDKLCKRCHTFAKRKPRKIKSFLVAFREIHKLSTLPPGMESSYIPSYDHWNTRQQHDFLAKRGILLKEKHYTKVDINRLFEITVRKRMLSLERDLQHIS